MISTTCSRASLRMLGKLADQRARKLLHSPGRSPMIGTMTHRPLMRIVRRYGKMRALYVPPSIALAELNTHGGKKQGGSDARTRVGVLQVGNHPERSATRPRFPIPCSHLEALFDAASKEHERKSVSICHHGNICREICKISCRAGAHLC